MVIKEETFFTIKYRDFLDFVKETFDISEEELIQCNGNFYGNAAKNIIVEVALDHDHAPVTKMYQQLNKWDSLKNRLPTKASVQEVMQFCCDTGDIKPGKYLLRRGLG